MPHTVSRPTAGADWMAARALLATRRLRPAVPYILGVFALVYVTLWAVRGPLADRTAAVQRPVGRAQAAERDTAPLVESLLVARREFARTDSLWLALLPRVEERDAGSGHSAAAQRQRDSLRTALSQLTAALDRAAKAPLTASYRDLANTSTLRPLATVRVLVDTLDLLEQVRQTLDPAATPTREFAELSQRANSIGITLQRIGQERQAVLGRQIAVIEATGKDVPSGVPDVSVARAARDSVRRAVENAESLLRDARQRHAKRQASAESAMQGKAFQVLGSSPFVAATSVLLVLSVLSFSVAVAAEARAPTIAHAREVERITGLPVLAAATAFRVPRAGRARLQAGDGADPFRMVYLSLTASGTREHAVCITGDALLSTVAVAARLAVSAAADKRATLLVDLAPGIPSASAFFGWHDEPGFTEAIASVHLWREVARPVGASEGLAIDVIPAGRPRQDATSLVQDEIVRRELTAFLEEYDFTVLVAPTAGAVGMAAIACKKPPTVVVARTAETRLLALQAMISELRTAGAAVHGILLLDK